MTLPDWSFTVVDVAARNHFFRWAVEGELAEVVPIPRYICSSCSQIVSVLFAFLVPYRHFTVSMISQAMQDYILNRTSYRKVAGEIANDDDVTQRPNHSQVWYWVDRFGECVIQNLEVFMQRSCMNAGKERQLTGVSQHACPNDIRARSLEKVKKLNSACRVLALAGILLKPKFNLVAALQSYFVAFVHPPLSILTGRGITLFTPQSLKHMIW